MPSYCCMPAENVNVPLVGGKSLCPLLCEMTPYCCQNHTISATCAELAQRVYANRGCEIYCGNGICEIDVETCGSCAQDCGPCEEERSVLCAASGSTAFPPNDPLFLNQWHLRNVGQTQNGRAASLGVDINVLRVWEQGFTGKGVRIAVIDDGVHWRNQDLFCAYDKDASGDLVGQSPLVSDRKTRHHQDVSRKGSEYSEVPPSLRFVDPAYGTNQEPILWDNHGTSVAGIIAASYDNAKCGVGVAHGATLVAVRLLGDNFDDWQAARALRWPNIDIYSNSWGPSDNGIALEPYHLTLSSIRDGISHGRNGKGSIYVWAAGNGKSNHDDSNYDALANSIFTISVAATDWDGISSSYSEPGTNILINAPSSSYFVMNETRTSYSTIATTDRTGATGYNFPGNSQDVSDTSCTGLFGGTSASCPIVTGVVALMLEAKPSLTWRDIQWILVHSASRNDKFHPEWEMNSAGLWYNRYYGFGTVDAEKAVSMVLSRDHVCDLHSTLTKEWINSRGVIPSNPDSPLVFTYTVATPIVVEHVVVSLSVSHPHRGHLLVAVQGPSGTSSVLAPGRPKDLSTDLSEDASFMSVQFWGESSTGNWTIALSSVHQVGLIHNLRLDVYGSPVNCSLPVDPDTPVDPPTPPIPALLWSRIKLVIIISVLLFVVLVITIAVLVEVAKMQVMASRGVDEEILKEMLAHEDSSEFDFFDTSSTSSLSTISE